VNLQISSVWRDSMGPPGEMLLLKHIKKNKNCPLPICQAAQVPPVSRQSIALLLNRINRVDRVGGWTCSGELLTTLLVLCRCGWGENLDSCASPVHTFPCKPFTRQSLSVLHYTLDTDPAHSWSDDDPSLCVLLCRQEGPRG